MSYSLTLHCGCVIYVSCHPKTRFAHTRVVQKRAECCTHRRHEVGARLYLWEMLPDARYEPAPEWSTDGDSVYQ